MLKLCRSWRAVGAAVVLAAIPACAGGGAEGPPPATPAASPSASPSPKAFAFERFDPPQRFDKAAGIRLPSDTAPHLVTLAGDFAFITTGEGLLTVELATGLPAGFVPTEEEVAFASSRRQEGLEAFSRPVLATVDGNQLAIATFTVILEGAGSTAPRFGAELIAVNTATHKRQWSQLVSLPLPAGGRTTIPEVSLIGIRNQLFVLSSHSRDADFTYVFDVLRPELVWTSDIEGAALVGDTVVGIARDRSRQSLIGLALKDGGQLWAQPDLGSVSVNQAGTKHALVYSRAYSDGSRRLAMLNAAGDVVVPVDVEAGQLLDCTDDRRGTVVCSDPDDRSPFLLAFEEESGRLLWQLTPDDAGRLIPAVSAVWHGAIYGVTDNGPVVLDALTGRDLSRSAGIAPAAVNDRCGVAPAEVGEDVLCFPAVG